MDGSGEGESAGRASVGGSGGPFLSFPWAAREKVRPTDGRTDSDVVCVPIASSSSPLYFPPISRSLWRPRGLIRFPSAPCLLFSFSFSHAITQLSPSLPRAAQQEEEGPRAGAQEEVQEELGLLGLREEGALHHKEDHQEAVVLLVRHHARLLQHLLGGRGALRAAGLAFRILA